MKQIIQRLILLSLALLVILVASCSVQASRRTRALAQIGAGVGASAVIALLGQPNRRELPGQPYLVYADRGCMAPCAVRLWWEWPLFHGIEAWSVDLDSRQRVVNTVHWVSP
jgi:hypothetical protein